MFKLGFDLYTGFQFWTTFKLLNLNSTYTRVYTVICFTQVQVIDISQTSAELCGPANRTPRRSKTQTGSDFKTGRICNLIYSDHLSTKRVWYSNGRFVSGCQMVWYVNGGLKTSLRKACLWFNPFKSLQTHLNTDTNTVQYSGVRYLDGYCIW